MYEYIYLFIGMAYSEEQYSPTDNFKSVSALLDALCRDEFSQDSAAWDHYHNVRPEANHDVIFVQIEVFRALPTQSSMDDGQTSWSKYRATYISLSPILAYNLRYA